MNWWKVLKGKVKFSEPLKKHTSLKVGGPAKFFIEPRGIDDLKFLLKCLKRYKIPFLVIGAGSNVLVSDNGVDGVVLRFNSPCFKRVLNKGSYLEAGSGTMLSKLVQFARDNSLSGAEFLTGIPGTVGGAVIMNAGIPGKTIGDLVEYITVMNYNGKIMTLNKREIKFGYRTSGLSKYIVLNIKMRLKKGNKKEISEQIRRYRDYRKSTHDLSKPSAGCVFRNPEGTSAGRLIDLCGLKGKVIGGAAISNKHANFILNLKSAQARDVLSLMHLIKRKVKNKFNISLRPEIKIW